MSQDNVVTQSVSYKLIHAFFLYFLASASFHYAKSFIQTIMKVSKVILMHSESHRFFTSIYKIFINNVRYTALFAGLFILICRLLLDFLIYKRVHYSSVLILFSLLIIVYYMKKDIIKYTISVFTNSILFKILNKKI